MFIVPGALFEFKLQRSEMYVAPLELRKSRAIANYKYRAPDGAEELRPLRVFDLIRQ